MLFFAKMCVNILRFICWGFNQVWIPHTSQQEGRLCSDNNGPCTEGLYQLKLSRFPLNQLWKRVIATCSDAGNPAFELFDYVTMCVIGRRDQAHWPNVEDSHSAQMFVVSPCWSFPPSCFQKLSQCALLSQMCLCGEFVSFSNVTGPALIAACVGSTFNSPKFVHFLDGS